ncbi:hypothetical protein CAL12_21905 [Bordetella genomosp. 8]|uniref:Acyltransferase 3 domain-containing protein n=1 Tax=Bordetella genomosp. 8 TaxID=1416806 RepID=A0A1W6YQK4_9BORD|nr:acyltransferase [Bordetella genomosp. 8]ARP83209.1 hypothetical protein CAL12_21905 [Bordetella genomosp. 8]
MDSHRSNNFDALRIALALIVMGAHLAGITGLPEFQAFLPFLDSDFAVKAFFVASGFLVMRSYQSSRSLRDFAAKRVRRIYPAYACAILLCLAIGACMTELAPAEFWRSPATWTYLAANAFFLNFLQPTLPGVFAANPMPAMDGALWTLKIELALYFCVPVICWLFRRFRALPVALVLTAASIAWVYVFLSLVGSPVIARQFPGQLSFFVLGSLFASDARLLARSVYLAPISAVAWWAARGTRFELLMQPFFYASLTILLAHGGRLHLPAGRCGDPSYGIYLYHFPIIQALLALGLFDHPWWGFTASVALTVSAAYLSWHLLERPLLAQPVLIRANITLDGQGRCPHSARRSSSALDSVR